MNINDNVTFTLTPEGAEQWNLSHADFWRRFPQYNSPARAGDVMKVQLWKAFNVLGPICWPGHNPGMERCEILTDAEVAERDAAKDEAAERRHGGAE